MISVREVYIGNVEIDVIYANLVADKAFWTLMIGTLMLAQIKLFRCRKEEGTQGNGREKIKKKGEGLG